MTASKHPKTHMNSVTAKWKAYQKAIAEHATRTAGERARTDREQTHGTEYHRASETSEGT